MRAFTKTIGRTIKRNFARFIAVTAIITLGICFVCGLGTLSPKVLDTFDAKMKEHAVADVLVKAQSESGLSDAYIDDIAALECVEDVQAFTMLETEYEDDGVAERFYILPVAEPALNRLELLEGDFPADKQKQCVVERASDTIAEVSIGDTCKLTFTTPYGERTFEYTVSGIVANPLFFTRDGEHSLQNDLPLRKIVYIDPADFPLAAMLPATDVYVRVRNAQSHGVFDKPYRNAVTAAVEQMKTISDEHVYLTLEENKSTAFLKGVADKIDIITLLFPIFFILVTALVVLTTMSRLISEERSAIGCYRTLGYSDGRIIFKYLLFALVCCAIGIVVGNAIGAYLLPSVICPAFDIVFFLPPLTGVPRMTMGLISSAAMLAAVLGVTAYTASKELREKPAMLLKPKAPKAGKKIFLERIPWIWNRLSFKFKSMFRNVFRYVGRLLMIVISVAGSTALILAGFGLHDIAKTGTMTIQGIVVEGIGDSIKPIAAIIILFAAALSVLVIYNLTNMDISERKREIATLKVLGYYNIEVSGYVYREILLMAGFGIILGIPLGAGILAFVFHLLDFGSMLDVHWFSYIAAALVELATIACVDLLLTPKICRNDMNESLKAVE